MYQLGRLTSPLLTDTHDAFQILAIWGLAKKSPSRQKQVRAQVSNGWHDDDGTSVMVSLDSLLV